MTADNIIPLAGERISTVGSYDATKDHYVIGDEARALGLKGRTNVFNFRADFGLGDAGMRQ